MQSHGYSDGMAQHDFERRPGHEAARNVTRVVRGAPVAQSPLEISSFLELKTVWQPVGV